MIRPRPPVPPVMSTLPYSIVVSRRCALARRPPRISPSRSTIWGSSALSAWRSTARLERWSSRSSNPKLPGCSDCATLTRPQIAAATGSGMSCSVAATAFLVTNQRRPWRWPVIHSWTVTSASDTAACVESTTSSE